MKKIKVAVISEIPTPYRDPLFERIHRLENIELTVFYCAPTDAGRNWGNESKQYPHQILPGLHFTISQKKLHPVKINPSLWARLSENRPDAVVIAGYMQPTMILAMLWCRRHRIPYLLWSESHHLTPRPLWKKMLKKPLVRFAVSGASAFLATSSNALNYLTFRGARPKTIFLLPNVPDVQRLEMDSAQYRTDMLRLRSELRIQGNPLLLYVGRLIQIKQVDKLIETFQKVQKKIPEAGLILVGDGPLRGDLQKLSESLSLRNVRWTGAVEPREIVKYYAACDVFTLPSLDEPWGVVVLEAMACGLPVVVSDKVGCARDLLSENDCGYVVNSEDDDGWEFALTKLLQEKQLRQEMGKNARDSVKQWNYDLCMEQFQKAVAMVGDTSGNVPRKPAWLQGRKQQGMSLDSQIPIGTFPEVSPGRKGEKDG